MDTDRPINIQRLIVLLTYGLHLLLIPAALGALVNALKIRDLRPAESDGEAVPADRDTTFLLSHHRWLLRTFLISLFFAAMGSGTMYYGVGYALLIGALLWWIYRMVRGLVRYAEHKPMPVA